MPVVLNPVVVPYPVVPYPVLLPVALSMAIVPSTSPLAGYIYLSLFLSKHL
jgi:hypothetical protein